MTDGRVSELQKTFYITSKTKQNKQKNENNKKIETLVFLDCKFF